MLHEALIIDPSDKNSTLDAQQLYDLGYHVTLATDLESALDRLDGHVAPDLVILDGGLPQALVESLLHHMRQMPRLRYVPVISMLSPKDLSHLDWNLSDPLHACLLRPFAAAELAARMIQFGLPVEPRYPDEGQSMFWARELSLA